MIKFFRKIRQNLLSKGKNGEYLKYAVGEIVLVVIGILIALQINNWNQERLNQEKAEGYLKSIVLDLNSDIAQYDLNIKNYTNNVDRNSSILQNEDYKKLEVDTIFNLIINYSQVVKISSQTYEKIKNAGFIESLGSKEINKSINDYYNIDIIYYQGLLKWAEKYSDKDYDFWLYNENFESNSNRDYDTHSLLFKDNLTKRKEDLITLIESTQARNHIRNAILRHKHLAFKINQLKIKTENLVESIKAEIAKQ